MSQVIAKLIHKTRASLHMYNIDCCSFIIIKYLVQEIPVCLGCANNFVISTGRVITVSSHCALETLPGLAVYGATKTALRAWSDGLRLELAKFGMHVVTLIPGKRIHDEIAKAKWWNWN